MARFGLVARFGFGPGSGADRGAGSGIPERFWDAIYYGGPRRVLDKYRRLAEAGATFASCWMMVGGIEHEKIIKSIRLMGEHVIPAVRDVKPVGFEDAASSEVKTPAGFSSVKAPSG